MGYFLSCFVALCLLLSYNQGMENVREIIVKNLIDLRKKNKLTQLELGRKINYSDKAISRWEKGEVLPDIEVLDLIANVYGVKIEYFFSEHLPKEEKLVLRRKQLAVDSMGICIVWTLFIVAYLYLTLNLGVNFWQAFIWPVPVSIFALMVSWRNIEKPVWLNILLNSLFTWTLITCIYLQLISYNIWLLFIVGIPVQATIITSVIVKASDKKLFKNGK